MSSLEVEMKYSQTKLTLMRIFTYTCLNHDSNVKLYITFCWTMLAALSAVAVFVYSMYGYIHDMEVLAVLAHHSVLCLDIAVISVQYIRHQGALKKLLTDFDIVYEYKDYDCMPFRATVRRIKFDQKNLIIVVLKISRIMLVYININIFLLAVGEVYDSGFTKKLLFIPVWIKLDSLMSHLSVLIWEAVVILIISGNIFIILIILFLYYNKFVPELNLLSAALKSIKERARSLRMYNGDTPGNSRFRQLTLEESFNICTLDCAKHFHKILSDFKVANTVLGVFYFVILYTGLIIMTFTGFALISDNTFLKIKFISILFVQMWCLYFACWFSEEIAQAGNQVRLAAYDADWIELPPESIKILRLIMLRTMKELRFISISSHEISMEIYMSMVKASYSYFNMLVAAQHN